MEPLQVLGVDILDPMRTLEECMRLEKKPILPVEAKFHYFECNCCREKNVQGWLYRDEINGEWIPFTKVHRCMDCFNNRQRSSTRDEIEKQRANNLMDRFWYIDPDLDQAGFKNFDTSNTIASNAHNQVKEYVKTVLNGSPDPMNIVLIGNFGSGKSHLATAAARVFREKGLCTGYIQEENYLGKIKDTFKNGSQQTEAQILKDLKRFDVLILDELGAENFKLESESWVATRILHLVNARKGKPTIYTTNINSKKLPLAVGERAYSRLKVNTKFIDMFTNIDYRDNFLK